MADIPTPETAGETGYTVDNPRAEMGAAGVYVRPDFFDGPVTVVRPFPEAATPEYIEAEDRAMIAAINAAMKRSREQQTPPDDIA
jgi:hypothetical protein